MRKTGCLILVMMLMLLFQMLPAMAYEEDVKTIVNCEEWVTLRSAPSVSSEALAKVPLGAKVIQLEYSKNHFTKVNWEGQEGYILSGYISESSTAFRTIGETVMYEMPEPGADVTGSIPAGQLVYSGYRPSEKYLSVMWNSSYCYVPVGSLSSASLGSSIVRYAEENTPIYRYATPNSDVIETIPKGGSFNCLSIMSANGMIYGEYNGIRGFVNAAKLYMISPETEIVSAEIRMSLDDGIFTQQVEEPQKLEKLRRLICAAEPGWVGKCPMNAVVTLELFDGSNCQFIYPTDGCSSMVGCDSTVYCIPDNMKDEFWDIFDDAFAAMNNRY